MFETCFLHIGGQKTGSTSLQHAFKANAHLLEQNGFHYPRMRANHGVLAISAIPESPRAKSILSQESKPTTRVKTEKDVARLQSEFRSEFEASARSSAAPTLVLSSEHFSLLTPAGIKEFLDFLAQYAKKTLIVAYVRHPASLIVSSAQQRLKGGKLTLSGFDPARVLPPVSNRLENYRSVVGLEDMILRVFDRTQLHRGDVIKDFFHLIGGDDEVADGLTMETRNESLSYEAALLADAIAKVNADSAETVSPKVHRNQVRQLKRIRGSKFAFSNEKNEEIRAAARQEARLLEERFHLQLPEPVLPDIGELWGSSTVDDIAHVLRDLTVENANLRAKLKNLRKS